MQIAIDILLIVASVVLIAKGASWLVDSAVHIAHRLGVSDLIIGLTIVAMGTSAPEFAVTILAVLRDMADISVGNIVGSNIFNLGFVLGGTAIIRSLQTTKSIVYRDGTFLLLGTVLVTIFLWDLSLKQLEGLILFALLFTYLGFLYIKREVPEFESESVETHWYDWPLLIAGFGSVLGGSHLLVDSATDLARLFGISEWIIGVTIIAAGTSMPELATSITAALKGRHGISIGNLLGSDIFNMFGVLGLAALIKDLNISSGAHLNLMFLVLMVLLTLIFLRTDWKISRKEGFVLLGIGLARWIYSFSNF
ncbi:MAG: calcium/sodium antiporter [Candidatus Marinimicrobia bacterium]|nr:calcium/sodium antiporter [Candidatus Neomarinimicrobiota bacterium]